MIATYRFFILQQLFKVKNFILSILISLSQFGFAQQYNFKRLSVEEGLSEPGLYSICEGPEGKLWIGLENSGVVKYDGWTFQPIDISLTGTDVRCVFKSSEDEMWIGSSFDGIAVFSKDTIHSISTKTELLSNHVRAIVEDVEGQIWVATMAGGISVFENKKKINQFHNKNGLPSLNSRVLLSAKDGSVWAGTDNGLVKFKSTNSIEKIYSANSGLKSNKILSLAEDQQGKLWVGTEKGLSCIVKGKVVNYDHPELNKRIRVKSLLVDDENNVWLGSKEGLLCLTLVKNKIQAKRYSEENGLSNNRIRCLYQDKSKAIWIGTYFGGINKFFNSKFSLITEKKGKENFAIRSIA